jgi:hypothetical protein
MSGEPTSEQLAALGRIGRTRALLQANPTVDVSLRGPYLEDVGFLMDEYTRVKREQATTVRLLVHLYDALNTIVTTEIEEGEEHVSAYAFQEIARAALCTYRDQRAEGGGP